MAKPSSVASAFYIVSFIVDITSFVIPFWVYRAADDMIDLEAFSGLWFGCITTNRDASSCAALNTNSPPVWMIVVLVLETVGLFFAIVGLIIVVQRKRLNLIKGVGPLTGALVSAGPILYLIMYDGPLYIHAGVGLAMVAGAGLAFSGLYLIAVRGNEASIPLESIPLDKRI